jgi:hypothetical protein
MMVDMQSLRVGVMRTRAGGGVLATCVIRLAPEYHETQLDEKLAALEDEIRAEVAAGGRGAA